MDSKEIEVILKTSALSIEKKFKGKEFVIIGIKRRGAILADRMKRFFTDLKYLLGILILTFTETILAE